MAGLLSAGRWSCCAVGRLTDGELMERGFSQALSGKSEAPMAASAMRSIVELVD